MTAAPRSTDKPYDLAVYIGRFQPFHKGHLTVVENALKNAERLLILIGSANRATDTRNPFTYEEREKIIGDVVHDMAVSRVAEGSGDPIQVDRIEGELWRRITICPLNDTPYDKTAWITSVQLAARSATSSVRPRVCLTGNIRDATSEYLTWFPAWDYLPVKDTAIEATTVRKFYFDGCVNFDAMGWQDGGVAWKDILPPGTVNFLATYRDKPEYARLMREKAKEDAYRAKWGPGPFQTVDPVIVKGDHVLMIRRGDDSEGAGMVGLPGGFLNAGETLLQGAVREAVEETRIFADDWRRDWAARDEEARLEQARRTLMLHHRGRGERFDDPHRSRRGHLITEAFLFVLPDGHGLPPVQGADDAKEAFWMPISEIDPRTTFEDHAFIIDKMLSLYA